MSELMTVDELAEYLRVTRDTVYRKAKTGEIPSIRIGRLLRFPKKTIDDWLWQKATQAGGKKSRDEKEVIHLLLSSAGVCTGPEDLSDTHDKYLYGQAK
jgi:excisionase family DNA binding protein